MAEKGIYVNVGGSWYMAFSEWNEATGGSVTEFTKSDGSKWRRHTFTSNGTLTVKKNPKPFDLFACGGGGGGGGGGIADVGYGGLPGGSGGAYHLQNVDMKKESVSITVGGGGGGRKWYFAGYTGGDTKIGSYLTCGGGGGGNFASEPRFAWHGQPTNGKPGSVGGTSNGGRGGGGTVRSTYPAPPVLSAFGLSTSIGAAGQGSGQGSNAPGTSGAAGIAIVQYQIG